MTTTATQPVTRTDRVNGIDVQGMRDLINGVKADAGNGLTRWGVTTHWKGGTVSESQVDGCWIGKKFIERKFKFRSDEPFEIGGGNTFANPQEYLLGGFNACMLAAYVMLSSLAGIELESLEIETKGEIDLRGFLQLDPKVKPGYDELHYTVRIKGNGTEEQFRQIHETVTKVSPNRFNLANPIRLTSDLVLE